MALLKMDHIELNGSLAEDESEVVLSLFCIAEVLETQTLEQTQHTLIIYGELCS